MTTYTIPFTVTRQHISADPPSVPVSDTQAYLRAKFSFDDSWGSLRRLAVFIGLRTGVSSSAGGGLTTCTVELDSDGRCFFPNEVLTSEHRAILVGAIGYSPNGQVRLTTDTYTLRQERSCFYPHATPQPPAPDLYATMMAAAADAHTLADELTIKANAGAFNGRDGVDGRDGIDGRNGTDGRDGTNGVDGRDGLTPHIGEGGHWYIGQTDTGVRAEGRDGATGMLPLNDLSASSTTFHTLPANHMTLFAATIDANVFTLGDGVEGYDNEWGLTLTMTEREGGGATQIYLPTTRWPLGVAPTFAANTTTVIRWYYVGDTLCGEWVTV